MRLANPRGADGWSRDRSPSRAPAHWRRNAASSPKSERRRNFLSSAPRGISSGPAGPSSVRVTSSTRATAGRCGAGVRDGVRGPAPPWAARARRARDREPAERPQDARDRGERVPARVHRGVLPSPRRGRRRGDPDGGALRVRRLQRGRLGLRHRGRDPRGGHGGDRGDRRRGRRLEHRRGGAPGAPHARDESAPHPAPRRAVGEARPALPAVRRGVRRERHHRAGLPGAHRQRRRGAPRGPRGEVHLPPRQDHARAQTPDPRTRLATLRTTRRPRRRHQPHSRRGAVATPRGIRRATGARLHRPNPNRRRPEMGDGGSRRRGGRHARRRARARRLAPNAHRPPIPRRRVGRARLQRVPSAASAPVAVDRAGARVADGRATGVRNRRARGGEDASERGGELYRAVASTFLLAGLVARFLFSSASFFGGWGTVRALAWRGAAWALRRARRASGETNERRADAAIGPEAAAGPRAHRFVGAKIRRA